MYKQITVTRQPGQDRTPLLFTELFVTMKVLAITPSGKFKLGNESVNFNVGDTINVMTQDLTCYVEVDGQQPDEWTITVLPIIHVHEL